MMATFIILKISPPPYNTIIQGYYDGDVHHFENITATIHHYYTSYCDRVLDHSENITATIHHYYTSLL